MRTAIEASDKLNRRNTQVFLQGSYRNHTNVRQESDVDVGILCFDTFCHASLSSTAIYTRVAAVDLQCVIRKSHPRERTWRRRGKA